MTIIIYFSIQSIIFYFRLLLCTFSKNNSILRIANSSLKLPIIFTILIITQATHCIHLFNIIFDVFNKQRTSFFIFFTCFIYAMSFFPSKLNTTYALVVLFTNIASNINFFFSFSLNLKIFHFHYLSIHVFFFFHYALSFFLSVVTRSVVDMRMCVWREILFFLFSSAPLYFSFFITEKCSHYLTYLRMAKFVSLLDLFLFIY